MKFTSFVFILPLLASTVVLAQDKTRVTKNFTSPNQIIEQCIAIEKLPLGDYSQKDLGEEQRLCALNFYDDSVALCPKTWSTSPGTIVDSFKNVSGKNLATSSNEAESSLCKGKNSPMDSLAKFKQTMNQADTSGTFSASSILYYHFSRALSAQVNIPVAVFRTMDKDAHYDRVTSKAAPPANASMNVAGWKWISQAESDPASYNHISDFFTKDRKQIYGVLLKDKGERYGVEINGTQENGWGKGQNFDFQKTPAFAALKSDGSDINAAINAGYAAAIQNPKMQRAFPTAPSRQQMILWMNEVSEIALLDYIFSQQDRVGNVDYRWYWTYLDEKGDLQKEKVDDPSFESLSRLNMAKITVPASLAGKNPVLLQVTQLGDNDAGGLLEYANYSKSTGMLTGVPGLTAPMKHLNKSTYQRLLKLARDFKNKGDNYQVLNREVRLLGYTDAGDRRFNQLIGNTMIAADLLEKNCRAGILKLDLVSLKSAMAGQYAASPTNCDIE